MVVVVDERNLDTTQEHSMFDILMNNFGRTKEAYAVTLLGVTVTSDNVKAAIRRLNDLSPGRRSGKNTFVVYDGKEYPAKFVLGRAWGLASGEEVDFERFSGGEATKKILEKLGFKVRKNN